MNLSLGQPLNDDDDDDFDDYDFSCQSISRGIEGTKERGKQLIKGDKVADEEKKGESLYKKEKGSKCVLTKSGNKLTNEGENTNEQKEGKGR